MSEAFNDFNIEGLDQKHTVVRCETMEEANIFLQYLEANGVWGRTSIQKLIDRWADYEGNTCYHLSEPSWCDVNWYREIRPEYQIVDFCDIYQPRIEYGNIVPSEMISYEDVMMFVEKQ